MTWHRSEGSTVGNDSDEVRKPFIIGVAGGTAGGKTTVCNEVVKRLNVPWVALVSMDRFYRPLTPAEREQVDDYNFDHPDAFDWPLMLQTVEALTSGSVEVEILVDFSLIFSAGDFFFYSRSVQVPRYCFNTHSRLPDTDTIYGADIIIFEGILILHDAKIRELFDVKVYVDCDSDIRLARRSL